MPRLSVGLTVRERFITEWRLDIFAPDGAMDGSLGQSEGQRSRATPQGSAPS